MAQNWFFLYGFCEKNLRAIWWTSTRYSLPFGSQSREIRVLYYCKILHAYFSISIHILGKLLFPVIIYSKEHSRHLINEWENMVVSSTFEPVSLFSLIEKMWIEHIFVRIDKNSCVFMSICLNFMTAFYTVDMRW